jgi:hypothetical protein
MKTKLVVRSLWIISRMDLISFRGAKTSDPGRYYANNSFRAIVFGVRILEYGFSSTDFRVDFQVK